MSWCSGPIPSADLYVRWLGPRGYEIELEKFEPWSGGSWRYLNRDEQGNVYAFHGGDYDTIGLAAT